MYKWLFVYAKIFIRDGENITFCNVLNYTDKDNDQTV